MRKTALLAVAVASVVGAKLTQAQTWDGGGTPDPNWSTGANWVGDTAPAAGGLVTFDNTGIAVPNNTVDGNRTINQLNYRNDSGIYTTDINGTLTIAGPGVATGNQATLANSALVVMPTNAATAGGPTGAHVVLRNAGGGGSVNITGGSVMISGRPGASVANDSWAILDLSQLNSFTYTQNGNSVFQIGAGTQAGSADNNSFWGKLITGGSTNVTVNRFVVGAQNSAGTQGSQPISSLMVGGTTNVNTNLSGNFYIGGDPALSAPSRTASGAVLFRSDAATRQLNIGNNAAGRNGLEIARMRGSTGHSSFGVLDATSASGAAEGEINAYIATVTMGGNGSGTATAGGGFGMLSMGSGLLDANSINMAPTTSAMSQGSPMAAHLNVGLRGAAGDTGAGTVVVSGNITVGNRTHASSGTVNTAIINLDNDGSITADRIFLGNNTIATGTGTVSPIGSVHGVINLNGGTLTTAQIQAGSDTAQLGTDTTRTINFDGGTLRVKAGAIQAHRDAFMQGHTAAYVHDGGATFDTNGQDITIAQPLMAPTGDGVQSITVTNGGAGYRAAPIVQFVGGGGTGATGVAQINAAGQLTGITVTNPGVGYTSAPTVQLFANGGTSQTNMLTPYGGTAATVTPVLGANTSGGLTKVGTGTLTLTGTNTYTGVTDVANGTLIVNGSLDPSAGVLVAPTATLGGNGSVGIVIADGTISPGASVGSLDVAGVQMFNTTTSLFEIEGTGGSGNFDELIASTFVTFDGTLVVDFSQNFGADAWDLFDFASGAGNFDTIVDLNNTYAPGSLSFNPTTGVLSVVPEPGSLGLLAAGALGLLRRRRQRRDARRRA